MTNREAILGYYKARSLWFDGLGKNFATFVLDYLLSSLSGLETLQILRPNHRHWLQADVGWDLLISDDAEIGQ
jgi:hypothetical protein